MNKWEKEHQVKERKIKQPPIKSVGDVGDILIIEGKNIAHIVGLVGQPN